MTTRRTLARFGRLGAATLSLVLLGAGSGLATTGHADMSARLDRLRLPFIENEGQVDARVAYYAPTFAGTVFVTRHGELVYALPAARAAKDSRGKSRRLLGPGWSLTETLVGGKARPAGQDRSGSGISYFIGNDTARWRSHVASFTQVSLGEVWPGVMVTLRAGGRTVEKVFMVGPGASVDKIRVRVAGAHGLSVDSAGALIAGTDRGAITFTAPVAYQEHDGARRAVAVAYRLNGSDYAFTVGAYDRNLPLVIDPMVQSTYLGGGADDLVTALAIHPMTGHVYVAGSTTSTDFPGVAGGAQPTKGDEHVGSAFVARLTGDLTSLIQATYLGGSLVCSTRFCQAPGDTADALAIDPFTGDVYVAGRTRSPSFPGTAGGAQPTHGGGADDAFVARLPRTLTAVTQATYLGGSGNDLADALGIQPFPGSVYVAGLTDSTDFPGTASGAQPSKAGGIDAFVAFLPRTLTTVTRATYLGGGGTDYARALAIHPSTGEVYVAGVTSSTDFPMTAGGAQPASGGQVDAFVARLDGGLTSISQATYLGGNQNDQASALAIHPVAGDVYVAGDTSSTDFPGTPGGAQPFHGGGLENGFVARLSASLAALIQATYLGGSGADGASALAIHRISGDVYVGGSATSTDFPGTGGGVQPVKPKLEDHFDGFVARLPATLTALTQATYLGGSDGADIVSSLAIHPMTGDVYVAGFAGSTDLPGAAGGAQPTGRGADGFVARLTSDLAIGPDLTLDKTHAGNFIRGQVAATYTVTVNNVGTAATRGTVTVRDMLAAGLSATALGGAGWTCALATLTCMRADALDAGASYPAIALTVNVAPDAPNSVTNTATVSGGGDLNPANNTAVDRLAVGTFTDVPPDHPFFSWIDALFRAGITGGCSPSPPQFCPDFESTRAQIAVFLLRGIHGPGYSPPAATGTMFDDVPASHPLASWIEELAREGITAGCSTSPPRYCPDARVTRAEMAVFLLRSIHGSGYAPPAATGMFADVPASNPFAPWIEQLTREGITTGCSTSPPLYCPDAAVTRGQMAVFLDRAFALPVPSFRPVVAYVANSGGKNVSIVDTSNNAVVATIGVGRNPAAVAVNPSGTRVYVANWGGASVSVIDTSTNLVVATIGAGSEPRGLAVNPDGTRLYVANSVFDGTLLVIDTSTHAVVATVPVEVVPVGVAANPAGTRVYVVNSGFSNSVSVIDTSTNAVIATVGVGQGTLPRNVAGHPAGSRVYVVNTLGNSVSVIDTSTNTVVATVPVGQTPHGVAVHPDGTRVYVANGSGQTVTVIETAGNTVMTTIPVASGPTGVAVHPDGTRLYVTISGAVAIIDTATNAVVGSVPVGQSPIGVAVTPIPSN